MHLKGIARSASGKIAGPWVHQRKPLMDRDSGHGMLFINLSGALFLALHRPNKTPDERPVFLRVLEKGGTIVLRG